MLYSCICNIIVLCKCHKPYNDNINDMLRSNNHCCIGFTQWCRRRCAAQTHKFWFRENPGKITRSLKSVETFAKICANLWKITENLGNLPKNTSKKWRQTCFDLKHGAKRPFSCEIGAKSHEVLFLEVIHNSVFMQCTKNGPKFFRASLGKFGQKSFAALKMCVLLHLWHYIIVCFTFYVFPTQPAENFSSYIQHGPHQKVLCIPVRSADWPTTGQGPTVFRPPTYGVIGSIIAFRKCWVFFGQPWDKNRSGFSWSEALTLSSCEAPSPTVTRKKWKRVNQFAQSRKSRYWRSKSTDNKNCKSLLECPTMTALVACDSKPINDTELLKSCLSGGQWILIFACKPTENVTVKYLTNHMHGLCFFISFTSVFSVLRKTKHTGHMCSDIKDVTAQREDHVVIRLPRL